VGGLRCHLCALPPNWGPEGSHSLGDAEHAGVVFEDQWIWKVFASPWHLESRAKTEPRQSQGASASAAYWKQFQKKQLPLIRRTAQEIT
jgi:hypothetical protein